MAWTAPLDWTTGLKVTAALMDTYVSDNDNALRAGGLSVTSQAANDILYASSSTQLARSTSLAFNGTDLLVASEGVGTSAVKATLHVKAPSNNWEDGLLLEHNSGDTGWDLHPENNGENALFIGYNANTAASLAGQTATAVMNLTSAGNVGVGTTVPGTAVAATGMVHSVNCVRAWGKVDAKTTDPGVPTLLDGFNVTVGEIASPAVGKTLVTFATALPHANYAVTITFCDDNPKVATIQAESTTSFQVWTFNESDDLTDLEWTFAVISD
jgi:hypothetical protein